MKEYLQKNFAVLLALALPLVLIVVVALVTYIPGTLLKTDYNFLYTACTDGMSYYPYNCDTYLTQRYRVEGGRLMVSPVDTTVDADKNGVPDFKQSYSDRIFLHDTKKNESREISQEGAQALTLSGLLTSPDGVSVSGQYTSSGDFFIFGGGGSSYGYYLTRGRSHAKINLINATDRYYYQNNFQFIGWVLPGRSR